MGIYWNTGTIRVRGKGYSLKGIMYMAYTTYRQVIKI